MPTKIDVAEKTKKMKSTMKEKAYFQKRGYWETLKAGEGDDRMIWLDGITD